MCGHSIHQVNVSGDGVLYVKFWDTLYTLHQTTFVCIIVSQSLISLQPFLKWILLVMVITYKSEEIFRILWDLRLCPLLLYLLFKRNSIHMIGLHSQRLCPRNVMDQKIATKSVLWLLRMNQRLNNYLETPTCLI